MNIANKKLVQQKPSRGKIAVINTNMSAHSSNIPYIFKFLHFLVHAFDTSNSQVTWNKERVEVESNFNTANCKQENIPHFYFSLYLLYSSYLNNLIWCQVNK